MYKVEISFNTKEWLCKNCGLLKDASKVDLKIGDEVFFSIYKVKYESNSKFHEVHGKILDIIDDEMIILDKKNIKTYLVNQNEVYLKERPALFLYNMYGVCKCKN